MADTPNLAARIRALADTANRYATEKNVEGLKSIRSQIEALRKLVAFETVKFDRLMDQVEMGTFGKNFASDVQRFRAKGKKAGRPAKAKVDPLASFDL